MAETIAFVNGTILTLDPDLATCEALLIKGDIIALRGSKSQVVAACHREGGKTYDLAGATLLPGFHDCHVHMMGTGLNSLGIDLYDCSSVGAVLDRVEEAAATYPRERWILGKRLDESRLGEGRPPTVAELDEVAPRHAVYLVDRGWHYTIVNSVAFGRLKLSPDLEGIRLSAGVPTGRLHEEANGLAKQRFFDNQDRTQREAAFI